MPKQFHEKIAGSVRKAHPGYSKERVEQETNAVMTNIGKRKSGKRVVRKRPASKRKSRAAKK